MLYILKIKNLSGAEAGLLCEKDVNIMAVDALAPCIDRLSAALALIM